MAPISMADTASASEILGKNVKMLMSFPYRENYDAYLEVIE